MIQRLSSLFRNPLIPRGSYQSSSFLWIASGLALTVLLGSVVDSYGYRLTNRDLRYFGYTGTYRGPIRGEIGTSNDFYATYDYGYINERGRERLPTPRRTIVTGPTGNNGFFLNHSVARGNGRRMTIRSYYSGVSYNGVYGEDMVGSGNKTVKVVRRGYWRPRYKMKVVDNLTERASYDGELFSHWRVRGNLTK